jgi:2,4-dienoyl-CoA reductase (NADPH2)
MQLLTSLSLGASVAPNRVMFGPIVTNLGDDDRRFTDRHVAFYERRARGGSGVIVTEGASVHSSDWPYERAPLAERNAHGWRRIADACHGHGSLVIASLDHAGGQGSSAYSQRELWAPSRVPEVNSREVPKWMETDDIEQVVGGFAAAASLAVAATCDGVEVNAGQHSLIRQFMSGLTNHRDDEWGDKLLFVRRVLGAVRTAMPSGVLGIRLSCDELAPWAGITPEQAVDIAAELSPLVDYLVVVRGSIYSADKTRADLHQPTGYNIDVCRSVRAAATVPVFLQGSIVDPQQAEWAIADGVCDAVEMTRAQLADPDVVSLLRASRTSQIKPCLRCNQTCQVRDARNPLISCVVEPSTGHEIDDPQWYSPSSNPRKVLVVGGGVAGLEAARVAARRGHAVRLVEQRPSLGGLAALAGPGAPLVAWLTDACSAAGVRLITNSSVDDQKPMPDEVVIQATGSQSGWRSFSQQDGAVVIDVVAIVESSLTNPGHHTPESSLTNPGHHTPESSLTKHNLTATGTADSSLTIREWAENLSGDLPVVVHDPIGGPIGVAVAEALGSRAVLVTPDHIAGNELSRSGDLAPANVRLQQAGVTIVRRSLLRSVRPGEVDVEERYSGVISTLPAVAVIDCGFREPTPPLPNAHLAAGDCVAPRTLLEAVHEGRRAALAIDRLD